MVDVFISYSRVNADVVARLAEAVKAEGYSVWWDAELPPHLSYGDVITEKIGAAKAAIVVWSDAAAASEWVRAEADVARGQKKLIQTSVDGRMPPMPFNQIQFASIGDWNGEPDHPGWRKVKASLELLCGAREGGDALPSAPAPAPRPASGATRPAVPARRSSALVPALLALLVLLAAAAVYMLWARGRPHEPGERRETAKAEPLRPPAPVPPDPGRVAAPAAAPAASDPPQILPQSSERALTEADLAGLTPAQLRIARNEIFARNGRAFRDARLRRHFARYPWYAPRAAEVALTGLEQANVRLLQDAEDALR